MTEPSQYFKGRTVQEQMNEVIGYVDVRSAEVATDAIAADVAQVHQDMLDADADAAAAAASAAAAAGTLANAVKKTGEASQSIAGDIAVAGDLTGGTVTVPTPVNNTDAASKKYVDDADALKLNITDVNSYAVGLTGNQNIAGTKLFTSAIVGMASLGTGDNSASITANNYKSLMRIKRSELSTFRGVAEILVWGRATGSDPELLGVSFHQNNGAGIVKYTLGGNTTCNYFVSSDNDYVYIGIKSMSTSISANSKQMCVVACVGFNSFTKFESYTGTEASAPEGTLIAETS